MHTQKASHKTGQALTIHAKDQFEIVAFELARRKVSGVHDGCVKVEGPVILDFDDPLFVCLFIHLCARVWRKWHKEAKVQAYLVAVCGELF